MEKRNRNKIIIVIIIIIIIIIIIKLIQNEYAGNFSAFVVNT